MKQERTTLVPPLEIFSFPRVWQNFDFPETIAQASLYFPPEGGMKYVPKEGFLPMNGVPFGRGTNNVAIFKRLLMEKIRACKNPLNLLLYKQHIREVMQIGSVSLEEYLLKPQYYSRPVREIYRVGKLLTDSLFVDYVCMIFEFDPAYRYRLMHLLTRVKKENGVGAEILRLLDSAQVIDPRQSSKYLAVQRFFKIIWLIPKARKFITRVFQEVKLEEFEMDAGDRQYAYG